MKPPPRFLMIPMSWLGFLAPQFSTEFFQSYERSPSATGRGLGSGATPVLPSSVLHQKTHWWWNKSLEEFHESMNYPLNTSKMTNEMLTSEVECSHDNGINLRLDCVTTCLLIWYPYVSSHGRLPDLPSYPNCRDMDNQPMVDWLRLVVYLFQESPR